MYNFYSKKLVQPPGCAPNILLTMKLTTLLLIMGFLQVTAGTFAQKVTLTEKNTPLITVFNKISEQTGYDFIISTENLKISKLVTIDLQKEELKPALDKLFAEQPLSFEIQEKMVVVSRQLRDVTQPRPIDIKVSGLVTDTANHPLAGASLKIAPTNKVYLTDSDGKFNFNAQVGDVVTVNFIGYIPYNFIIQEGMRFKEIIMHSAQANLREVMIVNTGYQSLPKERSTGAFTTISKKLYNQQVSTDVISRLEYVANGLSVFRNNATRSSDLMIRGLSTINGSTKPLIVVDNFPYEGDLNNLNPNDVESITVLKDAAAASIWGTRAGNGVIVINTKKGKFDQPLEIDFNSNVVIGQKPDLNYLTPMASSDYIGVERSLFSKGYYDNALNSPLYPVVSPVVQLLNQVRNGTIPSSQAETKINELSGKDIRTDFSRYMYQRSKNQQYHLNLNGGNDKLAYIFGVGYDNNNNYLAAKYDRLNLRSQASFKPIPALQITTSLNYSSSNTNSGRPAYGNINPFQPYLSLADENGTPSIVAQTYSQSFKSNAAATGNFLDWNYYPLTDYQHSYITMQTQDIVANFGANYKVLKGLNFDLKYQYEKQTFEQNGINDAQSYYARNLINIFSSVNAGVVTRTLPVGGILDLQTADLAAHALRLQANFGKDWDKHSVSFIAGEELRQNVTNTAANRNYGYNEENLVTAPVDYTQLYRNSATQELINIPYVNSLGKTTTRFISFFANGSYTYDSKYTLSGSVRRDGSNLFGVNTNDKWKPLWSTGISWDLGNESFYHFKFLPYLKVRATYGYSGNVDASKSAVTTISYSGTSIYTNSPFSNVSNFANPDLRWEKTGMLNLGIDFRFIGNRVYGNVDLYQKSATDLYATVPIDYTAGLNIATVTKNVGAMKSKGIDVEVNGKILEGTFSWLSTLNFNFYRDKVTNYYLTSNNGNYYVLDSRNPVEGHPVWSVYSYRSPGLDNTGNPQGYLGGILSEDYTSITGSGTKVSDLKYNGPRFPVYFGSFGNTFNYKGVSLTVRMAYSFGGYFRRQSIDYYSLATTGNGNADFAKRWQTPGDEKRTIVPAFVYPLQPSRDLFYAGSEVLVEKSDCIRIQYMTLSYDLLKQKQSWLPFKSAQIYFNSNNIGIIWRANKLGIDPDYTYTNTVFPNPRTLSIGIKATL